MTNLCALENKQAEIASRLQELNQLKEKYSDLYNEILDLIPEDLVEPECHQFSDYFRQIREVSDKAQRYIFENTAASLADGKVQVQEKVNHQNEITLE